MTDNTLFAAENVQKSFEGIQAIDGASLSVADGEIVGLIGPNGAGKTTFFNVVTGHLSLDAGNVWFEGNDITNKPPHELAQAGLVRTFQQAHELTTLTVRENLKLPATNHPGEQPIQSIIRSESTQQYERQVDERATEIMEQFELTRLDEEYANSLSGGQRKLLGMARGLILDPKLYMLDEPFAGINPTLTNDLIDHILSLNEEGMSFVIIEHDLERLAEVVDRLIVLNQGAILAAGPPDKVLNDDEVIDAYLGETV